MRLTTAGAALLLLVLYANNPSDAWTHNWHTGPINCYICDSAEECAASSGKLNVCASNAAQSCVAVFGSDGSIRQRGCSDDLIEACGGEGVDCYECRSSGCNNLKTNANMVECVLCDAQDDENCLNDIELVTDTRRCNEHCITALYPRTNDKGEALELVRTCLDDLYLDDREACVEGTMETCVACSGAKCNTAELGVRGSCNFCSDATCDRLESKTCRAVPASGQEQCFIQLDESGAISELGCLSQYNLTDAAYLLSEKRLWSCSGENCNVISALPSPHTCRLCNSRTDSSCATDPSAITSETECSHPLNTDCYSLLREDGHTERGCLSSLEQQEFVDCLQGGNATKCVTCSGNNCNIELQPGERLTCHICNSKTDANCEQAPNAPGLCQMHTLNQGCVTALDGDGNTLRGCSEELTCSSSDRQSCQHCTSANCNTDNLRRRADGQPGQWAQELPLRCLSCSDAASCAASNLTASACKAKDEYCMTVFDAAGQVSARGCSNSIEDAHSVYCDANSGKCHNCNSNGCNSASSLDAYTSCVYCDSALSADCVRNVEGVTDRRQCQGQCMTAMRPVNGSSAYDLVRGCLDDKDPEDQLVCASGEDAECAACSGDACNVKDLELKSLSCYICTGNDDCEVPDQAACLRYNPEDRCYTLFDESASVSAMGCASDLDDDFMDKNLENLIYCSENNCNSFENLPQPQDCAVCSSLDDENCAVNPSLVTQYDSCTVLPNTGCATRILADGSTSRGCLSSLTSTQLRNCLKGDANCDTCVGDLCNKDIYPADRRRCERCNSKDDPSCGSTPSAAKVCPRHVEGQGCSTKLVRDITYRGCQTEFTCDDSDKQVCRLCNGDNCNVVDLAEGNIGYPGRWATPPINCYTCEGVACQGTSLGPLKKCVDNVEQNCATVFASNGSVVLRGCTDILYADAELTQFCDETAGNCKFCQSSGCNNAHQLDTYVDCVLCDGSNQANCVRDVTTITRTRSCQGSCFVGLYARNRTDNESALELSRGCLDDLEYDDRLACADGTLENCVACSGASCNKQDVPEKRLSCNYCDDESCDTISPKICTAYRSSDQCYIHVGDRRIESMGCASDLENSFMRTNRRDLYLCSDDNCNVKDVLNTNGVECQICNSTIYSGCIEGKPILGALCEHYLNPECYTHITEDGVVKRGCLMDTKDELFDDCTSGTSTTCKICDTPVCNSEVFPADWQRCLRCDSNTDADCEQNPAEYGKYCRTYVEGDKCVTSLEKGRTRRGCQSELYCDPTQVASCRVCEGESCNSVDLAANYVGEPGKWQDLPLSCHVCSDKESCASPSTSTPITCSGNNKQTCATVFNEAGEVTARGCSDAILEANVDYCESNAAKCPQCKSNGCNSATSLDNYVACYECDAEQDADCAWETPSKTRQCQGQCMTGLYPRSSAADSALLPTRGCLDDLEEADRTRCAAGTHASCKACTGALCNGGDIIESPQECYTCADELCEDMVKTKCLAYREKDQCYLAFDSSSVVAMGCASDFETQVINELVAQQRLLLCEGQNCNHPDTIPNANTCLQCDSLSDPRCATNPNQLFSTDICSQLPYTQCVTHVDEAGTTTRGCLSSLGGDDFYGCLTGSSEHCEICTGTNCNGLSVFPTDRRRCHQCDSESNSQCATAPSSSAVCPVYAADDTCVTSLTNGVTHRGCSSSLSCTDPSDTSTCRVCSGSDACNTIDLERLNADGKPGTWQDPPISCLTCASETECSSGGGTLAQCAGSDNCVSVFDATGNAVTSRSCYSALDSTAANYCDEQPGQCPRCNSNGCNVADSLSSYVECLVCDSSESADCVRDTTMIKKTRQCHLGCMTAFRPLFGETSNPSYALVRNCLDDKEEADRTSCGTTADPLCASCKDANCNTQDLVTERLSCLSCIGEGCQNAQPASCANYRESDACYIQFDEQRSVVAQGCLSEFSHAEIYLLQLSKRLLTCPDKDCNTLESLPAPQSCVLCSSRTDRSCAVSPASVTSATSCQLAGLPECYSRVLSDGATERGCLASLEGDEFLGCYNGTAEGCASCLGDNCNKELYPADRASCHICNSDSDASCESAPNSLAVCPVYAAGDACVTNLRGGVTYRGCASSLSCEPNSKTCVSCQGDGCNVADLAALSDDNHGKWQDLPLSCLSCQGTDCQASELSSERCADNNEQDCITVFNEAGAVIRRGCQDAIEEDAELGNHCASNGALCPLCKSNDCNNATALTQYSSCIYCDSYKSSDCLWEPLSVSHKRRQCQGQCMTALYGSSEAGLDLIRTCLDDKEPADQQSCANGSDPTCVACAGDACNVQSVPEDRLSCYQCEGEDCEEPSTRLCEVYKPADSCFLWMDEENSIKQLGCLSSFRNQDLESIMKTKRIAVCDGDNCNVPQNAAPVKCAVCDSRVDATCATSPLAVTEFQTCSQLPHTHCVTKLEDDGATIRSCLFDLPAAEFAACLLGNDENCEICGVDGCNREVFPADRQQCYSCSSADDSSCESDPSRLSACAWVSDTETCQTHLDGNHTIRGCSSAIGCNATDWRNCRNCVGSRCNSIDLANRVDDGQHGIYQELPLKCHVCEGDHCLSSLGPAVQCSLNPAQDCKTVFEADGTTVRRRGCADDVDDYEDLYCRQHPELCFICKSNECNDAWAVAEFTTCVYCNSTTDGQCVTYPQSAELGSRKCQGKCMVSLVGQELVRSCLNDKELYDQAACGSEQSSSGCISCEGDKCNTIAYPTDRLSCHVCSSATGCSSSHAELCSAYDKNDFCFAKYNMGAVELLGCASSQNSSDLQQWRLANELHECLTKDCNELSILPSSGLCLACDSSKTPACAQAPTEVSTSQTCYAPLADCLTRLDNGHTIRGCLNSLNSVEGSACVANGTCAACAGSKCNVDVFPANRRKCHICNSSANSNCAEEPNNLAICPVYAADDTCVASRDSDNFIQRGCGSQLECDTNDAENCKVCNMDACNTYKFNGSAALGGIGLALTLLLSSVVSSWRL